MTQMAHTIVLHLLLNPAELWRPIDCSKWRPRPSNSTSDFVFGDFAHLWRSKSTCRPNFGEISQSTA